MNRAKKRKPILVLGLISLLLVIFLIGWFFTVIFEGDKPNVSLQPLPPYLSQKYEFSLSADDQSRGLKRLQFIVSQEGRDITIFEKKFLFNGLFNQQGVRRFEKGISVDPFVLNLAQGSVDLSIRVWDYSRRGGGDGNLTLFQHKMIVDTIPPAIRAISRMHNINEGGAGLVIYQTSSDTTESGVFVNEHFFPGFPTEEESHEGIHLCYFALPKNLTSDATIFLWAKDKADNVSKATFYYHIRNRRFRQVKMKISDRFLKKVLGHFSNVTFDPKDSDIEKYLKINNDVRKENHEVISELSRKTSPTKLWEGPFLRLKNAATMSQFADKRSYYYMGKKVDEQLHLGIDLASLSNSPVQASNHGRVIFADMLGIYGFVVVLDHGQGLISVYGHLSIIDASLDQEVKKGDVIGFTGQTGLAGGDHLHFAIMVNGIFVNPLEWWDGHWIKDNISRKLELLEKPTS